MNILLVNPFPSVKFLDNYFKTRKINTIALYTSKIDEMSEYSRPDPSYFDKQIFIDLHQIGNIEEILKPYAIDFVINGTENFTHITDIIANKLTPQYANDTSISLLRMDKFRMHQHLAKCNINYIKQNIFNCKSDNLAEFVLTHEINYPCFLKPLHGLGSYCVSKIDSFVDLEHTLNLFNDNSKINITIATDSPKINDLEFLICDYIEGEEYFVDSFSFKGKHYIGSVQKYSKAYRNNIPVYQYAEIVNDQHIIEQLIKYTNEVLTALGNNNGFAHTEIKINKKDNKPVLIEVNPRISGAQGVVNQICHFANLYSQVELLDLALSTPENLTNLNYSVKPNQYNMWISLFNWSGKNVPADISEKLKSLKTVVFINQIKSGVITKPNINTHLFSVMCLLILSSDNFELIQQELAIIQNYDNHGWS